MDIFLFIYLHIYSDFGFIKKKNANVTTLPPPQRASSFVQHCSAAYGKSSVNVCLFFFTSSMRCDLSGGFLLVMFLQEEQGAVQAALLSGAGLHSGKLDPSGVLLLGQRGT